VIGRRFGRVAGVTAGLLQATYGPGVYYEGELLLVVLEAPLNLAATWALDRALTVNRSRAWALAGACWGLAALTRPNILALLPIVSLYVLWTVRRPSVSRLAMYWGATVLVLTPVLLRNAIVGHDVVPVASQGGLNYYLGNNPAADGMSAVAPEFRRTWTGGLEDAERIINGVSRVRTRTTAEYRNPPLTLIPYALGQPARLRLDGFPPAQYGSIGAVVSNVARELRDGRVRVELSLAPARNPFVPMQHGAPGTIEVGVEQISPASLVLRAVGRRMAPERASKHP